MKFCVDFRSFSFALFVTAAAAPLAASAQSATIFQVSLTGQDCIHDVLINGIPMWQSSRDDIASAPLNAWLQSGENELIVVAAPETAGSNCKLDAELLRTSVPDNRWKERMDVTTPTRIAHRFNASVDPLGALRRVASSEGKARGAIDAAAKFAAAVHANTEAAMEMSNLKIQHYAIAFGHPAAPIAASFKRSLSEAAGRLAPLPSKASLNAKAFLGGTLWRVRSGDGPLLSAKTPDGALWSMEAYFALTNDGWQLAR